MIPTEFPQYPWQKVGVDLFHLIATNYLLLVDYFSRYPEVHKLKSTTSTNISMKETFSRFGIPEIVRSDNGPQFTSEQFSHLAQMYGFEQITSSPPQSNGQVERTVKTVKKLLKETRDPHIALLTYRITPFSWYKRSPAELLMGRQLRGNIPVLTTQLIPDWSYLAKFRKQNVHFKAQQKLEYDRRHDVRVLPPIHENTEVWVRMDNRKHTGTVVRTATPPRSYIVDTPSGEVRRNRWQLNMVPQTVDNPKSNTETGDTAISTRERIITRSQSGTDIRPPDRLYYKNHPGKGRCGVIDI